MKEFEKLQKYSSEIATLKSIASLLQWDQDTYMPPLSIERRSQENSYLSGLIHKKQTGKKFRHLLSQLIDLEKGNIKLQTDFKQQRCLEEYRRDYILATKLPKSFVSLFSKTTSKAMHIWAEAKQTNNFKLFKPHLEKIVELSIKKANLLGFENHPLDALIDLFEPKMTTAKLDELFSKLATQLTDLLSETEKLSFLPFPKKDFPHSKQLKLARYLAERLGLEKSFGRVDESVHPFSTSLHPKDVRITTRINQNLLSNIYSIMHEFGHAIYDANLPYEYYGTPLSEPISMGIHESQSRLWETIVGKSFSFTKFLLPLIQEEFPELKTLSHQDFYKMVNNIEPSLIRIEADEISYCLHIILRYELEKDLLSQEIKVADLPAIWKEKMEKYFKKSPLSDREGCLQDIHWSMGAFGYFSSYALGNIYAANFFSAFKNQFPGYEADLEKGDFSKLKFFLKEKIHKCGRTYGAEELVEQVTKEKITITPYIDHLKTKIKIFTLDG